MKRPTKATSDRVKSRQSSRPAVKLLALCVLIAAVAAVYFSRAPSAVTVINSPKHAKVSAATNDAEAAQAKANAACDNNPAGQDIVVSVSRQHLWACDGPTAMFNSAVVTGADPLGDATPLGTYHIYAKYTNQVLRGCDNNGCWNDPVSYWMPFLPGQDGPYGIHDATWRTPAQFGNISAQSDNGSHGCVEMPLTGAAWIYNWSSIGTAVTIES